MNMMMGVVESEDEHDVVHDEDDNDEGENEDKADRGGDADDADLDKNKHTSQQVHDDNATQNFERRFAILKIVVFFVTASLRRRRGKQGTPNRMPKRSRL